MALIQNVSGVVPIDLLAIIRVLVSKHHFTVAEYNAALTRLGFSSYEAGDKPCPVPASRSSKVTKLSGKAVTHWVHVRNFPFLIRGLVVDPGDTVLSLGLLLHEIIERITAQEFFPYEIDLLERKIQDYLEMRKVLRADHPNLVPSAKPKHHFMKKDTFETETILLKF